MPLKEPNLKISFELPDAASPSDLGISSDSRKLTLAMKNIKLSEINRI